jgi:hypothetical protein
MDNTRFQDVHYSAAKMAIETGNLSVEQLMRLMWLTTDQIGKSLDIRNVSIDIGMNNKAAMISILAMDNREYTLDDVAKPEHEGKTVPFYSEYNN